MMNARNILQAMACGVPPTGTNVDGIKELMKHGENGILCETHPGSLREAIITLMQDKELKERLGENTTKTVEQKFSLDKLTERELKLYLQLSAWDVSFKME